MTYTISYKLEKKVKRTGHKIKDEIVAEILGCKNFLELRNVIGKHSTILKEHNEKGIYPEDVRDRMEMQGNRDKHDQIKVTPRLTKQYIKIKVN